MDYNSDMDENTSPNQKEFIGRWQDEFRRIWDELPDNKRVELTRVLDRLPGDPKGWRRLIHHAVEHIRLATGGKRHVAIVGPVNVGKSTLYNTLIRSADDRAKVSAVPGTTRQPQRADAGLFTVIDTPGADAAGAVGLEEKESALEAAGTADFLLVLFDAVHGIRKPEQVLFSELRALDKPCVAALNKIDLVSKERSAVLGKAAAALGLESDQLIPLSARKGQGIDRLLLAVVKSEPGIVAALGAALPQYRWELAQSVIGRSASSAAAIAVTPLPFLDFFPLTGLQITMVMTIARIFKYRITLARARELIATLGMAFLGRTLFYELSKLGGPPGWMLAAAVAAGTTVALGYASIVWFERGETLSRKTLDRISRMVVQTVLDHIRGIGRRRPDRSSLRDKVREALRSLPDFRIDEEDPDT
jgi:small GTP-binding protein